MKEQVEFDLRVNRYMHKPWTLNEEPLLDDWLERNAAALKLVAKASLCTRFLQPIVSQEKTPALVPNFNLYRAVRVSTHLLSVRAMEKLHRGETEEAVADLEVIHRLGFLHATSRRDLSAGFCFCSVGQVVLHSETAVAAFGGMTSRQLNERGRRVLQLNPAAEVIDPVSPFERAATTSILWAVMRDPTTGPEKSSKPQSARAIDEALRTHHRFREQLAAAFRVTGVECERKLEAIEERLEEILKAAEQRKPSEPKVDESTQGREFAADFSFLIVRGYQGIPSARNRLTVRQRQAYLAYVLCAYKLDHGRYPERLDAKELRAPPEGLIDAFAEKPFDYRVENGKARVLCRGADGKYAKPVEGGYDDIVLELP